MLVALTEAKNPLLANAPVVRMIRFVVPPAPIMVIVLPALLFKPLATTS